VSIIDSGQSWRYSPSAITIRVGDTVTWRNGTEAPHTVTSESNGPMNSSILNDGDSYRATFQAVGTFAYYCELHPDMRGTVRVQGASSNPTPRDGQTPLPPTDAASSAQAPPLSRRSAALVLIGVASFTTFLMFGSRLHRRRR
jgi:hypothetical protein